MSIDKSLYSIVKEEISKEEKKKQEQNEKKAEEETLKFIKEKKKKKSIKLMQSPVIIKVFQFPNVNETEIDQRFERLMVKF